jgi:hypothetical protein
VPRAAWRGFVGGAWHPAVVRTAYRCRAYPDQAQQQVLARTFGCVRVVWNRTLAERQRRWQRQQRGTAYAQTDAALTVLKKDPELAWLNEVSSVPLQQALRHQHGAFRAFFGKRARYLSRSGRGDARPAAPATTGTSTRPRTSLRQVLPQPGATRAMPAELMSDTARPLRCNRP